MENIAVCVLIVNNKNLNFLSVSLKEDHNDFNLPGGKVKSGENLISTAKREIKEETGINIYNLNLLHKENDDDYEVITFLTYHYDGIINTKEDHIVKWLPIYELTKSQKWPRYNNKIYNKFLENNLYLT